MLIKKAFEYMGEKENNPIIMGLVDYYNEYCYPLVDKNRRYKIKYSDSWCAMFTSVIAHKMGVSPDIFPYEVSVFYQYKKSKERGSFTRNLPLVQRNDLILFDFKGIGGFDHVGIIEERKNGYIKTIEGNKSDKVGVRYIEETNKAIRGFILLDIK